MYEEQFSKWYKWTDRNDAAGIKSPGIYAIAILARDLSGTPFKWLPEIRYIGMTNSRNGLKGRLKQFDNTIIGKGGHGGADRAIYKHQNYETLIRELYVSVSSFECDVKTNEPTDLRIMGEVVKFEYDCIARYVELFKVLPEFNNKMLSPKYSLTIGKK